MRAEFVRILKNTGVGVMPTDTIYGLVGTALVKNTVERIYRLRRRNPEKPFIILIGKIADLKLFGVKPDDFAKKVLREIWPNSVSVILPCKNKRLFYLHRGTKTLAFRLSKKIALRRLLKKTGPLVAPSANPEGLMPASTIAEAKKYFGNKIDFYIGAKTLKGAPSTLIEIKNKKIKIIRQGAVKLNIEKFYN